MKFARKVSRKLPKDFWTGGVGFYLDGASFTHKLNPYDQAAITYGKGVIAAEQYFGRINADIFSSFVTEHFTSMFKRCPNPKGKLVLQDGDPSQNSCKARSAWDKIGARKFSIPARSPDLNPIRNIFHIVKKRLHQDALKMTIEREDFQEFSAQVKRIPESVPVDVVDRTIRSMDKRVDLIVKRKGQKIRYYLLLDYFMYIINFTVCSTCFHFSFFI